MLDYCKTCVDVTSKYGCALKINHAFFGALGYENELACLIDYVHDKYSGTPVILDAKRGDIGHTADRYAIELFHRYSADAATVNPFLGWDCVQRFLEHEGKGVFVLCRTSNPGASWLQDEGKHHPLYFQIAERVQSAEDPNLNLVVGATDTKALRAVRKTAPGAVILIPGVGSQGGEASEVVRTGRREDGLGMLVNVSRGLVPNEAESPQFFAAMDSRTSDYAKTLMTSV